MEERGQAPHVAILSSPGMGHLTPVAELAKQLVLHHGFTATIITYSDFSNAAQDSFLAALPADISSVALPPFPPDELPPGAWVETLFALVARSLPHIRNTLRALKATTRLAAYVVDIFGGDTLSAASELGVPRFLLSTSTFMFLSLMLHLPALDAATTCEYRDLPELVRLTGCVPVRGEDLLDPMQDRKDDGYRRVVHSAGRFREADGILVNSFVDLEPGAAEALREREPGRPPAYPVGPLVRTAATGGDGGSECLEWLDGQPRGSVLFVSFGSGGTLSTLQTRELAAGLEMSGQRFLWVVRCPNDREASGVFFGQKSVDNPLEILPEGFLERTEEVGFVVPSWAPQIQVLSHGSTGGFLSHCGWNSTLESIVHGVPMIAWPLYAEQRMNAVMLTEGAGMALRPTATGEDGVVGRDEIARVVRELMEGEGEGGKAARERVRRLQAAATKALSKEGSSYKALDEITTKWKDSISM